MLGTKGKLRWNEGAGRKPSTVIEGGGVSWGKVLLAELNGQKLVRERSAGRRCRRGGAGKGSGER